jgi:hypothetical protein
MEENNMSTTKNREEVDKSLGDSTTTIFILIGQPGSKAGEVHDLIETKTWDDCQKTFLFPDASLLTAPEIRSWFNGQTSQYYAVLGGKTIPKAVAKGGPITDLLKSNGKPDYLKIRDAFLQGDEV